MGDLTYFLRATPTHTDRTMGNAPRATREGSPATWFVGIESLQDSGHA